MAGRRGSRAHRRALVLAVALTLAVVPVSCSSDANRPDSSDSDESTPSVERDDGPLDDLVAASGLDDPASIDVPEPDSGEAAAWLDGDGAAAVRLVGAGSDLALGGVDACSAVASDLDAIGPPGDVLDAAIGTPDDPTRDILVNLHTILSQTLGDCADPEVFDAALPTLAWHVSMAAERLDQLGVDR